MIQQALWKRLFAAVILVLGLSKAQILVANPLMIQDETYEQDMRDFVLPEFAKGEIGFFEGVDGLNLRYGAFPIENPRAAIVLVTGYTESFIRYAELIYTFQNEGYSVYTYEHRGMGGSDRILKHDSEKTHVKKFEHYVRDLETFLNEIVHPRYKGPLFSFSHSMGGGVMTRFLQLHPGVFSKNLLSSPMLQVKTGSYPTWVAKGLAEIGGSLPFVGSSYAPTQKGFDPSDTFSDSTANSSEDRWRYFHNYKVENPGHANGGSTFRWVRESMRFTAKVRKESNASLAVDPILILRPTLDTFVEPGGQDTFCSYAEDCQIETIGVDTHETRHELYNELQNARTIYFHRVLDFYDE